MPYPESTPRLLFVTLSNIGDLIMTTPALQALHAEYPNHLIDIVADQRSSSLLTHCPYLGQIYHRRKEGGVIDILKLVVALRRTCYTAIVDLRTDFLPWLLRGQHKVSRRQHKIMFGHSTSRHFAVAAGALLFAPRMPEAMVWIGEEDRAFATNVLTEYSGRSILAIAPGANWPGKIWPREHYAQLVSRMRDQFPTVIILGNQGDHHLAATDIANISSSRVLNLCGQTTLTQAAALLDRCAAFVGNDSGLGHLAAARGIPTLTLFGPGDPDRYRPWGNRTAIVRAPSADLSKLHADMVAVELRQLIKNTH